MKHLWIVIISLCVTACSKKTGETVSRPVTTENSRNLQNQVDRNQREIDSLKSIITDQQTPPENDYIADTEMPAVTPLKDLSGRHSLTLQWLSWDRPGTITFKKIGENKYHIQGSQNIDGDYLTIDGRATLISDRELAFEGTIESFVTSNGGLCVRKGPQTFLSTKNRKYWRLQNMEHCFGLTDYVDIYF
ncbi:MAG TPA: hypothetical protein DCW95_06530 [Chryseobacterium sp.]|nr:hypothetical protein [Chryseobacterium sp.]